MLQDKIFNLLSHFSTRFNNLHTSGVSQRDVLESFVVQKKMNRFRNINICHLLGSAG
jgi:hypothetical protein